MSEKTKAFMNEAKKARFGVEIEMGYSQFVVGSGFPESAFKATATLDRT